MFITGIIQPRLARNGRKVNGIFCRRRQPREERSGDTVRGRKAIGTSREKWRQKRPSRLLAFEVFGEGTGILRAKTRRHYHVGSTVLACCLFLKGAPPGQPAQPC